MKFIGILFFLLSISSCRFDKGPVPDGDFPQEVANILQTNCATLGCHNAQSSTNAAGLDLSSWESLMKGSRTGAAVVPFASGESFLLNFVNTFPDLGSMQTPSMPPNRAPLSRTEVEILRNWILSGAPNKKQEIAFSGSSTQKKIFVVNQGCDLLSVIDIETGLLIRSLTVGTSEAIESPHSVRLRPDGKIGYIVFLAAPFIQYFNAETNEILGEIEIGFGQWNTIVFSSDNNYAFAADFSPDGKIACVDLRQNKLVQTYQGSGFLVNPHGQAYHPNLSELWVAPQYGNFIYRLDVSDPLNPVKKNALLLDNSGIPTTSPDLDPHELAFSPDAKYLFVTCSRTNELRVIDLTTETLIQTIPTGLYPQELSISLNENYPLLAMSCMEDSLSFPAQGRGSVLVINWKTLEQQSFFYPGFQPHGLVLDDRDGSLWVANRNVSDGGPAPHHSGSCSGKSGYVNRFQAQNGTKLNAYPIWLSVDPYGICVK